jgi:hypothetical protein
MQSKNVLAHPGSKHCNKFSPKTQLQCLWYQQQAKQNTDASVVICVSRQATAPHLLHQDPGFSEKEPEHFKRRWSLSAA